jgi:glycosyltransferase involved in cell wall biosynthesis
MCFVGRLSAVKNLENLIQAVSQLSHGSLVVIGEGEQRPRLESLARQSHARVEFKGRLPNEQIPLEINRSEIFILPSLSEGHPKALVEAMSCGAAVIANDAPGMRELVEHGKTGWLCQVDAASLQDAIQALMSNPTLREALGRNARRYALENFALERVVEMEAQAIEEVCRGKGDEGQKTRDEGRSLEDGR